MKFPAYITMATALSFGWTTLEASTFNTFDANQLMYATTAENFDDLEIDDTDDLDIEGEEPVSNEPATPAEPTADEKAPETPAEPTADEKAPETPAEPVAEESKVAEVEVLKEEKKDDLNPVAVVLPGETEEIAFFKAIDRIYFSAMTSENIADLEAIKTGLFAELKKTYSVYQVTDMASVVDALEGYIDTEIAVWTSLSLKAPEDVIIKKPKINTAPIVEPTGLDFVSLLVLRKRDDVLNKVAQNEIAFRARKEKEYEEANRKFLSATYDYYAKVKEARDWADSQVPVGNWKIELEEYKVAILARVINGSKKELLDWWTAKSIFSQSKDYQAAYRLWVNAHSNFDGTKDCLSIKEQVRLYHANAYQINGLIAHVTRPEDKVKMAYMAADLMQLALDTWTQDGRAEGGKGVVQIAQSAVKLWREYQVLSKSQDIEMLSQCLVAHMYSGDYEQAIRIAKVLEKNKEKASDSRFWYLYAYLYTVSGKLDNAVKIFNKISKTKGWTDIKTIQTSPRYTRLWKERSKAMATMFLPRIKINYKRSMFGSNKIMITNLSDFDLTGFWVNFELEGSYKGNPMIELSLIKPGETVSRDTKMTLNEFRKKVAIRWDCSEIYNYKNLMSK